MESPSVEAKLDFAQEVRSERLSILWKVTLGGVFVMVWLALIFSALSGPMVVDIVAPAIAVSLGCLGTRHFLKRRRYGTAVWAYTSGLLCALGWMMFTPSNTTAAILGRDLVPFALPVVIMLVGLLMPMRATFLALAIAIAMTVIVPAIGRPLALERPQIVAIVLMLISAGIAAQTSGEVYGIAEWALQSYSKERKVKEQLFDSQQEVQRSYVRQKVLAEQLQETNVQLEAARVAALEAKNFRGQFLANMSHELRTPLNAIIGFSETMLNFPMMYDNQTLPPAYKSDMTQIYTSGKHLLQLINDILDLSKVDAGRLEMEIEQVELDPVFRGILSTAAGLIGDKPIQLLRDTPASIPTVRGDSLRIRQVILNLLSNAAKFTDQGSITVGARDNGKNEVLIWVKDTGIGIPPQDMDKIFEEFRQGASGRRKGRAGSGLGLAISRQLMNLMGGRIWVESKLNEGSTFYLTLPIFVPEPVKEQQG
jgi:signal transduction histidine kinase